MHYMYIWLQLVLKPELEQINLRLIQADANFYGPKQENTNFDHQKNEQNSR